MKRRERERGEEKRGEETERAREGRGEQRARKETRTLSLSQPQPRPCSSTLTCKANPFQDLAHKVGATDILKGTTTRNLIATLAITTTTTATTAATAAAAAGGPLCLYRWFLLALLAQIDDNVVTVDVDGHAKHKQAHTQHKVWLSDSCLLMQATSVRRAQTIVTWPLILSKR